VSVDLVVNGAPVRLDLPEGVPLLVVLRNDLGLTGARFGCGEGLCGACTVLVDGAARQACQVQLGQVAGSAVETVEALLGDPLHPLVEELLAGNAGQCGYCLSGIVMAAKALLDRAEAAPPREAIAAALDGNLCRCGAHGRILDAIERAAARSAG
jgi:nicotinate dehydrogenase subunit A